MLILGRHVDEVIRIGDDIKVIVKRISPDQVRIGIEAPGMEIHREEVYQAIQEEKRRCAMVEREAYRENAIRQLPAAWAAVEEADAHQENADREAFERAEVERHDALAKGCPDPDDDLAGGYGR